MAQAVRLWPLAKEDRVLSQVSPCEICGGQIGSGRGVSRSISFLPCWYHFHQCFILILIYLLFLSEGQSGKTWENSKSIQKSRSIEHSNIFIFVLKSVAISYVMEPLLELAFVYVFWIEIASTTVSNNSCYITSNTELRVPILVCSRWQPSCPTRQTI